MLFENGKYCCLGVLAELLPWYHRQEVGFTVPSRILGNGKVAYVFGKIEDEDVPPDVQHELVCMNDSKHQNFTQIADWIEENVQSCDPS